MGGEVVGRWCRCSPPGFTFMSVASSPSDGFAAWLEDQSNVHHYYMSCTMQTKKITQNAGRSILVPDFWIWRPVVDIPQPRFREGAGGEVSRKSKI